MFSGVNMNVAQKPVMLVGDRDYIEVVNVSIEV